MNRRERDVRFKIDLIGLFVFALIVAAFFVFVGRAQGAPPRQAVQAKGNLPALRRSLQVVRRQRHYLAIGCFHVAPKQWVCPLPDPRAH